MSIGPAPANGDTGTLAAGGLIAEEVTPLQEGFATAASADANPGAHPGTSAGIGGTGGGIGDDIGDGAPDTAPPQGATTRNGAAPVALHLIEMAWPIRERLLDALWAPIVSALRPADSCAGARVIALHRMAGQQRLLLLVAVRDAAALSHLTARPCLEGGAVTRVETVTPLSP